MNDTQASLSASHWTYGAAWLCRQTRWKVMKWATFVLTSQLHVTCFSPTSTQWRLGTGQAPGARKETETALIAMTARLQICPGAPVRMDKGITRLEMWEKTGIRSQKERPCRRKVTQDNNYVSCAVYKENPTKLICAHAEKDEQQFALLLEMTLNASFDSPSSFHQVTAALQWLHWPTLTRALTLASYLKPESSDRFSILMVVFVTTSVCRQNRRVILRIPKSGTRKDTYSALHCTAAAAG